MRPPHTQDVAVTRRGSQQSQFSTPTEESRGRRSQKKPQLEGYVHPTHTSWPVSGCGDIDRWWLSGPAGSQTPNSGDISKGIDRVIEVTVYEARVEEGDDGEGIPYDPNLVCPKLVYPFPFIFAISHIHASDHTHWSYASVCVGLLGHKRSEAMVFIVAARPLYILSMDITTCAVTQEGHCINHKDRSACGCTRTQSTRAGANQRAPLRGRIAYRSCIGSFDHRTDSKNWTSVFRHSIVAAGPAECEVLSHRQLRRLLD